MEKEEEEEFLFPNPYSLPVLIVFGIWLIFQLIFSVVFLVLLFQRRRHRIIAPRKPITLFLIVIANAISAIITMVSFIVGKPPFCTILSIIYILMPVFGLHFTLIIPSLVLQNDLNNLKVQRDQGIKHDIWKYKILLSQKAHFCYMILIGVIEVTIFCCLTFLANIPGDCLRNSLISYASFVLCLMLGLGYFIFRFQKIQDPYYMYLENRIGSLVMLPALIIVFLYPPFPQIFPSWFDIRWINLVNFLVVSTINLALPVTLTFPQIERWLEKRDKHYLHPQEMHDLKTEADILALNTGTDLFHLVFQNGTLYQAFVQFTTREWSVENTLFLKAVQEFKTRYSAPDYDSTQKAVSIIKEYIETNAPLEINIDDKVRKGIVSSFKSLTFSQGMFDSAEKMVQTLVKTDSFERFQKSPEFRQALLEFTQTSLTIQQN